MGGTNIQGGVQAPALGRGRRETRGGGKVNDGCGNQKGIPKKGQKIAGGKRLGSQKGKLGGKRSRKA